MNEEQGSTYQRCVDHLLFCRYYGWNLLASFQTFFHQRENLLHDLQNQV